MGRIALVTGAGGYVGRRLTSMLLRSGYDRVVCLDVRFSEGPDSDSRVVKQLSNICDGTELVRLFRQYCPDVVIHVASYGMSGPAQLRTDVVHAVNVGGTRNVLAACVETGIPACVYVSTYNVVFNGCTIENGVEADIPSLPDHAHVDPCTCHVVCQAVSWSPAVPLPILPWCLSQVVVVCLQIREQKRRQSGWSLPQTARF